MIKPQDQILTCASLNFIKLLAETWVPMALCPQLDLLVSNKMQTLIQDFSPVGIGHTHTYSHAEHGCISCICLGDKDKKEVSLVKENSWVQKKIYSNICSSS